MSDNEQKTLCAHVEEELRGKDPHAYMSLLQSATNYPIGCGRSALNAKTISQSQELPKP